MKKLFIVACLVLCTTFALAQTPKTGSWRWSGDQYFDGANTFTGNQTITGDFTQTGDYTLVGNIDQTGDLTTTGVVTATLGVSPGTADDSLLLTDTVTLTNAEIKGIRAAPKELVASPGAGKFLELVSAVLILDYGSDVLTESTDNMVIQWGTSGADATAAIEATGFIDAAADQMAIILATTLATDATADIVNNSLELFNTGDGEYAGNASADSTMIIKITYRVHTTGL